MAYEKINWKNRLVAKPMTYRFVQNEDGTSTLIRTPGTVYQPGTPVNAENLGHMDEGIFNAHQSIAELKADQPWDMILNGNFANPVNMGGKTLYTGGECGLEAWESISDETRIELVSSNTLKLSRESGGTQAVGIRQRIQVAESQMGSGWVTLACCDLFSNTVILNARMTSGMDAAAEMPDGGKIRMYHAGGTTDNPFVFAEITLPENVNDAVYMKWIRLMPGEYTAEDLPAYMPRNKRLEALLCGVTLTPRNLMRNSHFLNPVNLSGKTSASDYELLMPGWWTVGSSPAMAEINENGLKIDCTASGAGRMALQQIYTEKVKTGDAYTIMAWLDDGTVCMRCGVVASTENAYAVVAYCTLPDDLGALYCQTKYDKMEIYIQANEGKAVQLRHAALFKGAYTADMRPTYTAPSYNDELMESLRTVQYRSTGDVAPTDLCPPMVGTPVIRQMSDGRYEYCAEPE